MTEQEEKKQKSEAHKGIEMVWSAFVIKESRRCQVAMMKIGNLGVAASENFEPVERREVKCQLDLMSQEKCYFHYEEREQVCSFDSTESDQKLS